MNRSLALVLLSLAACSAQVSSPSDAGADSGAVDAGGADAGPADSGATDAGPADAGAIDAGDVDAGAPDSGDCISSASMPFPPFPANPSFDDAGANFVCADDAGAISDLDAVIAAMPPGSWRELPCTQMANVCPPAYNHYLCNAVMIAWAGLERLRAGKADENAFDLAPRSRWPLDEEAAPALGSGRRGAKA